MTDCVTHRHTHTHTHTHTQATCTGFWHFEAHPHSYSHPLQAKCVNGPDCTVRHVPPPLLVAMLLALGTNLHPYRCCVYYYLRLLSDHMAVFVYHFCPWFLSSDWSVGDSFTDQLFHYCSACVLMCARVRMRMCITSLRPCVPRVPGPPPFPTAGPVHLYSVRIPH